MGLLTLNSLQQQNINQTSNPNSKNIVAKSLLNSKLLDYDNWFVIKNNVYELFLSILAKFRVGDILAILFNKKCIKYGTKTDHYLPK